jgi:hypothetical protein
VYLMFSAENGSLKSYVLVVISPYREAPGASVDADRTLNASCGHLDYQALRTKNGTIFACIGRYFPGRGAA